MFRVEGRTFFLFSLAWDVTRTDRFENYIDIGMAFVIKGGFGCNDILLGHFWPLLPV